jgi:hypothetical protein
MKALPKPTGLMLVGILFVCFFLQGFSAAERDSSTAYSLSDIEQFHSDFIQHKGYFVTGELPLCNNEAHNPWSSPGDFGYGTKRHEIMPCRSPVLEKIHLNGSHSERQVGDLKAINTIDQRDVIYDESQIGDSGTTHLINSMDVNVVGEGQPGKKLPEKFSEGENIENFVGKVLRSKSENSEVMGKSPERSISGGRIGNYMDIAVSGITVSAINTIEGGSAVATSNIIIKPVQIIFYPSEVDEKLR